MGLWSRILGRSEEGTQRIKLKGPGDFATHLVGESDHEENLSRICGRPRAEGLEKIVTALVVHDDGPLEQAAVSVQVSGLVVGGLNSLYARNFRERMISNGHAGWIAVCKAKIRAEWDGGEKNQGNFSVTLDLPPEYTESVKMARPG